MAVSRKDVLTYLEESNMVEISELISEIEEKFGVSAAAPVAVAAATSSGTLSLANLAIAVAAAIFISSLIVLALTSSAPLNI